MRNCAVYFCLVAIQLIVVVHSEDEYCNVNYCGDSSKHIACGNDGAWDTICDNPVLVEMTSARQNIIVDIHNQLRANISNGLTFLPKAARMQTVLWYDLFQAFAELNVKQCNMMHDPCRNTKQYKWSGQNICVYGNTGTINIENQLANCINSWYNEIKSMETSYVDLYPEQPKGTIGHFGAIAQDKNRRVGCAASEYKGGQYNWFLLTCNYGYTNLVGAPIYISGNTASLCRTGVNKKYPGLCNTAEVVASTPS